MLMSYHRYIQSIGVGYNQFPLEELQERGIVLCNAVGVNSPAVAEHALALMLSVSRKIFEARDNQHKKNWPPYNGDPTAREFELSGKTVGVVGLGAIGEGVARLCKAFGCRVIGTKANPATYPAVNILNSTTALVLLLGHVYMLHSRCVLRLRLYPC
jgi:D-2-hydroxyacid dehydrogenase (NADP+)